MTNLFRQMLQATAAFKASRSIEDLEALECAERAYFDRQDELAAKWGALPEGERKDNADLNAEDTCSEGVFDREDRVRWYEIAIATYEMAEA